MSTLECIGWLSNAFFAVSALPQAVKSWREGHARGMAWATVVAWYLGELGAFYYFLMSYDFNAPIVLNYVGNIIFISIILKYKIFPTVRTPDVQE